MIRMQLRSRESPVEARQLTFVLLGNDPDVPETTVAFLQEGGRSVGGAVVDDDDFVERNRLAQGAIDRTRQVRRIVVIVNQAGGLH